MNHHDHVSLLKPGIQSSGGRWADLGSGEGAFTLALWDIIKPNGNIISIDKDADALHYQKKQFSSRFPDAHIKYQVADFTEVLEVRSLDGIVMANSLHFADDQLSVLQMVKTYLKPSGILLVVEYNTDHGNHWVPYPFSDKTFAELAEEAGFHRPKKLAAVPSSFLREIYSAIAYA